MAKNDHQWGNLWDPFAPGGWDDLRDRKYIDINRQLKKEVDSEPPVELPVNSEGDNTHDGTGTDR